MYDSRVSMANHDLEFLQEQNLELKIAIKDQTLYAADQDKELLAAQSKIAKLEKELAIWKQAHGKRFDINTDAYWQLALLSYEPQIFD